MYRVLTRFYFRKRWEIDGDYFTCTTSSRIGRNIPNPNDTEIFQAIYPFLPFTYAISAIRETVGGMLWDIVTRDLLVLSAFVVVMIVAALLLKTPINKSSENLLRMQKEVKSFINKRFLPIEVGTFCLIEF